MSGRNSKTALVEVHPLDKIKKLYSAFSLYFVCVCVCVFDEATEFFHPVATADQSERQETCAEIILFMTEHEGDTHTNGHQGHNFQSANMHTQVYTRTRTHTHT